MKNVTKLVLLAGVGGIAAGQTLNELRKKFDMDRMFADYNEEMLDIATGRDGLEVVDHLEAALLDVFPEYARSQGVAA